MKENKMRIYIEDRVKAEARYIRYTKKPIREVAKVFYVSKSTVHKDMTERLKELDPTLYEDVMSIFKENFEVKHIHGGEATRKVYEEIYKEMNENPPLKMRA